MVGLSIILEGQKNSVKTSQVIGKTTMTMMIGKSSSSFLDQCFLCKQKLMSGKDIYMYRGDWAFCSEECRCRQIFMDEEETVKRENCSMAAFKPSSPSSSLSLSSSSSSGSRDNRSKVSRRIF